MSNAVLGAIFGIIVVLLSGLWIGGTFDWPSKIVGFAMVGGAIVGLIALWKNS